jgi:hypothetical protein
MRLTALSAILGALALSACADGEPAGPLAPGSPALYRGDASVSGINHKQRPFRMVMVYGVDYSQGTCAVAIPTGDPEHPTLTVEMARLLPATGTASHMGRVIQDIWIDQCAFDAELGALVMAGTSVIRAANGDMITTSWTGTSYFDGTLLVQAVLDGGTGRFQDVAGEVEFEGYVVLEPTSPTLLRSSGGAFSGTGSIAY